VAAAAVDRMLKNYIKKDLKHRKSKFLFLIVSLAIGIAAIIGVLQINFAAQDDLNNELENFGANMVIYPKSDAFSLQYGGVNLASVDVKQSEINEEDISKIYTIKDAISLNIISPKVVGAVYIKDKLVPIVGVNFTSEYRLKKWWQIVGEKPEKNEILVGYNVYNDLELELNKELKLNNKTKTISGFINKTETQDDAVIFMDIKEAQEILNKKGKISLIEVMAFCNTCPIEEMIRQIEEKLPNVKGVAAKQLITTQMTFMSKFLKFGMAISIFILLVSMISLTASMTAFVKEKTKEIGIFRAVGFRKKDIGKIIIAEALIIALVSSILGYLLGQLVAIGMGTFFLDITVPVNFLMIFWAAALSIMVCTLSTVIPLKMSSKITVTEALRSL
jgi:putative ABC transport system permease protein